jgi:hypothetical protein
MKVISLDDWTSFKGMREFEREYPSDRMPRMQRIDIELITEGCSVFVTTKDGAWLVFSGAGRNDFSFGVGGEFVISVVGDHEKTTTSIRLPWGRMGAPCGWAEGPTYTQLDLKAPDAMSIEVMKMQRLMSENMRVRDEQLAGALRELKALRDKK